MPIMLGSSLESCIPLPCLAALLLLSVTSPGGCRTYHGKKLFKDVMIKSGYNRNIRPVSNKTDVVQVAIGGELSQLIDVDERNQAMTVNMWLKQTWIDPNLCWDPEDYGNVSEIMVPAQSIWHPEIVLYNNADGVYELNKETKAKLIYNGTVKWKPPARLSSSCTMDVRYFPFDEQRCELKFGSWTYSKFEVEIDHLNSSIIDAKGNIEFGMDLKTFYRSFEWDVMGVPAHQKYHNYAGHKEPFPMWVFIIYIRRKYNFYVVNIIIPLVAHTGLTILVFLLPSDSKQKIPLSITILLSLTVYFLLLTEIVPDTSLVLPLLGEYLIFTLFMVIISLMITVLSLNVHFRSSATHEMPNWVRKIFLYFLPRILRMRRPKIENSHDVMLKQIKLDICSCSCFDFSTKLDHRNHNMYAFGSRRTKTQAELNKLSRSLSDEQYQHASADSEHSPDLADAINNALFIANHLKKEDEFKRTKEDWKYVAMVIDRVFFYVYVTMCTGGTIGIILNAPILREKIFG